MSKSDALGRQERTQLIRARERAGLTREQLASKIGMAAQSIYKIEGGFSHTTLAKMQCWVNALGPSASLDLFWAPNPTVRPQPGRRQGRPRVNAAE